MQPAIFGIAGQTLTKEERELFRAFPPLGFILFKRNIETPEQVKALTASLRELTGRADTPILIDQEGARVQKLRPPHWVHLPCMREIGDLYARNSAAGIQAVKLHAEIVSGQIAELGFNTVCAPVLDIPLPGAHDVIGDRAFAEDVDTVVALGTEMVRQFLQHGIMPIIKHAPGHGRSDLDSHYACPVVAADKAILDQTDFKAFRDVAAKIGADKIWTMTAHIVFKALDEEIVSVSKTAIDFLRSDLGLSGPIISDTIEMDALGGALPDRALATLAAGCDAFLHCSGQFADIKAIANVIPEMTAQAKQRFAHAALSQETASIDWRQKYEELKSVLNVTQFRAYHAIENWAAA